MDMFLKTQTESSLNAEVSFGEQEEMGQTRMFSQYSSQLGWYAISGSGSFESFGISENSGTSGTLDSSK